jgi:N-glycosylase/DNA lyase
VREFSLEAENFDLEETMTCGQTFCWHRVDGELYSNGEPHFYTFRDGKPIIVEQVSQEKITARTELPESEVREALGLHHDLEEVFSGFPEDEGLEEAKKELWGLRIVQDEFFPCLISYLCSPQMRIPRIKQMHNRLAEEYGEVREVEDVRMRRFPTQEELSQASEEELRELGVGYRAKYIVETLEILQDGFDKDRFEDMGYGEARKEMKKLYGVGDKVADCVLLFSLGFHEAYPIDTWAEKALRKNFPELHSSDYGELSENMRDYFGEYAGYAQEYLFHAARKGIIET